MLTEEQVKEIKEQLFKQIEKFPAQQKETAKQQIEAMDATQLEEFLEKNKLIKQDSCIFCSIIKEETPSYKIDENNEAVAILDINPVSEGHTLIIPKEHKPVEDVPSALTFAHEVAKKLKAKLETDELKIESSNVQGHGIINIIPIYKDKKPKRKKAEEKELQELQKKLAEKEEKEKAEIEKKPKKIIKIKDLPKAPIRIP
jgi:diadenosine tetraphosphate (Ap4A) HIT family hydrolase